MGKVLRDLWILLENGMVIYNHTFETSMDPQLFGGFMSAIQTVAMQLGGDGLSTLELASRTFYFAKSGQLLFIATVDRNIKPKRAQEELRSIVHQFFALYSDDRITNWRGNLSEFDVFKHQIEQSFEDPVTKMKDTLW